MLLIDFAAEIKCCARLLKWIDNSSIEQSTTHFEEAEGELQAPTVYYHYSFLKIAITGLATWLWIIAIKISDKFLNTKKKTLNHASLPFKKWRLKLQKKENYIQYNIFLNSLYTSRNTHASLWYCVALIKTRPLPGILRDNHQLKRVTTISLNPTWLSRGLGEILDGLHYTSQA